MTSQLFRQYSQYQRPVATTTSVVRGCDSPKISLKKRPDIAYTPLQRKIPNTLCVEDIPSPNGGPCPGQQGRCYGSAIELQDRCTRTKNLSYL